MRWFCDLFYHLCLQNTRKQFASTWIFLFLIWVLVDFYASAHFRGLEVLCFWVVCLSVRPSVHLSVHPKSRDNSRMYEGNWSINYDVTMNWLDLGFHRSKGGFHCRTTYGKIQFWSQNSNQMYQVANFANERDLLGQC